MNANKELKCVILFSLILSVKTVKLDGNGYTLDIAISNQVSRIPEDQRANFLQAIRDTMTKTSQLLFKATDYRFYFKTVNVLLPREWNTIPGFTPSATAMFTYIDADVRVEETMNGNGDLISKLIQTKNTKPCGMPGEYILILPDFFINNKNNLTYEDKAKVMIRVFAHYRFGVFEEHGFLNKKESNGDTFPYMFTNIIRGEQQINTCNNTEIEGKFSTLSDESCKVGETNDCLFWPDTKAKSDPTSSLMSMDSTPTVNQICDSLNYDRTAPNRQNYWCRNRSIKTVLFKTPDFVATPQVLPPNSDTTPSFNFLKPIPQTVYIVLDTSIHSSTNQAAFNYAKSQIISFLSTIESVSNESYVGVAGMSGQSTNLTHNKLGGYLTEVQPLVPIRGRAQDIGNIVSLLLIQSASGLLVEPAILDVVDNLSPFTYQSGSVVLLIKLSNSTATSMNVESEAIQLLNSRNIRLVTAEIGDGPRILERITLLTAGSYFSDSSDNYESVISNALNQIRSYLTSETSFTSRRIQLVRSNSIFLHKNLPRTDYAYIDWKESGIEFNFFILKAIPPSTFTIQLRDPRNIPYTPIQNFTSWDGQYNIYTAKLYSSLAGYWKYSFDAHSVPWPYFTFIYLDVVQILPNDVPVYMGGGGPITGKPVEIEVYTSGVNGVLTMSSFPEDNSFMIYASVKKGAFVVSPSNTTVEATVRRTATGDTSIVTMKDDGVYPDMLDSDGTFTAFYRPPADGFYNISVRLDSSIAPDSFLLSPTDYSTIDHSNFSCCSQSFEEDSISTTYQRLIPYAAKVQVIGASGYSERPTRIMDFQITNVAPDGNSATMNWTAPAHIYGSSTLITSYQLVYSASVNDIIDENGLIPTTLLSSSVMTANPSDVIGGSLTPLPPGSDQVVIISLHRPSGSPRFPLYFTIGSVYGAIRSYPAPIQFIAQMDNNIPEIEKSASSPTPSTSTILNHEDQPISSSSKQSTSSSTIAASIPTTTSTLSSTSTTTETISTTTFSSSSSTTSDVSTSTTSSTSLTTMGLTSTTSIIASQTSAKISSSTITAGSFSTRSTTKKVSTLRTTTPSTTRMDRTSTTSTNAFKHKGSKITHDVTSQTSAESSTLSKTSGTQGSAKLPSNKILWITLIISAILALLTSFLCFYCFCCKNKTSSADFTRTNNSTLHDACELRDVL